MFEDCRIAITGVTGFVGNNLARMLPSKNVLGIIPPFEKDSSLISLKGLKIKTVVADVLDLNSLVKAFEGVEIVYHLAAIISTMPGRNEILREVNTDGTKHVIEACEKCGVEKLVYISSVHALAHNYPVKVIDESIPFDPYTAMGEYDSSKAEASLEVLKAVKRGLNAVILCPTGIIGPYDFKPSRMGELFIKFAKKEFIFYIGGGYDFVDVRDLIEALIAASRKGKSGEKYIISGHLITISELISLLRKITGVHPPCLKIPIPIAKAVASISSLYYQMVNAEPLLTTYSINTLINSPSLISHAKAYKELGYRPRPIEYTIRDTIKWFKDNGFI